MEEGCAHGTGNRKLLRFGTMIGNIGVADFNIDDNSHISTDNCHGHEHFEEFADYQLFDESNNELNVGHKAGFCVLDAGSYQGRTCNGKFTCSDMGISAGCQDVYNSSLACQWLDITDVPDGTYILKITTNPNGILFETDYTNNSTAIFIQIQGNTVTLGIPDPDPSPAIPKNFFITNGGQLGQNPNLSWSANTEADLKNYEVYRCGRRVSEGFLLDPPCSPNDFFNIVTTTSTSYTDVSVTMEYPLDAELRFYYHVKAVDNAGQRSYPSNERNTFGFGPTFFKKRDDLADGNNPIPHVFALDSNYPNPFNPSTMIRYSLPEVSSVSLVIYDLRGNEVTRWTLANETAGYKRKTWDGTDKNGNKVPAGVYLLKMTAESKESQQIFTETRKMVLLK